MRTLAPALAAHLAARKAVRTEMLVRIGNLQQMQ